LVEQWVLFVISFGMLATIFYAVLVRYLPISGTQMAWTEEFTTLLLMWFAFWGAAALQRKDEHFKVDIFINLLPPRLGLVIAVLNGVLMIAFLIYLMVYAFGLIQASWHQASIVMHYPKMLFPLAIFLCSGLMIIHIGVGVIVKFRASAGEHGKPAPSGLLKSCEFPQQ
jgi:TRAP-type C4-dicarboxylate transport system permease small subunit